MVPCQQMTRKELSASAADVATEDRFANSTSSCSLCANGIVILFGSASSSSRVAAKGSYILQEYKRTRLKGGVLSYNLPAYILDHQLQISILDLPNVSVKSGEPHNEYGRAHYRAAYCGRSHCSRPLMQKRIAMQALPDLLDIQSDAVTETPARGQEGGGCTPSAIVIYTQERRPRQSPDIGY